MSEQAPSRGWLSRFTSWPAAAWAATVTAIAILAVAGGPRQQPVHRARGGHRRNADAGREPGAIGSDSHRRRAARRVERRRRPGRGERNVSVTPIVRYMIDSGEITERLSTDPPIQAAVVAWAADGSVMNRTGASLARSIGHSHDLDLVDRLGQRGVHVRIIGAPDSSGAVRHGRPSSGGVRCSRIRGPGQPGRQGHRRDKRSGRSSRVGLVRHGRRVANDEER